MSLNQGEAGNFAPHPDRIAAVHSTLHRQDICYQVGRQCDDQCGVAGEFCARRRADEAGGNEPIVVHGGGPRLVNYWIASTSKPNLQDGMRVTDEHTMDVVEMVLEPPSTGNR